MRHQFRCLFNANLVGRYSCRYRIGVTGMSAWCVRLFWCCEQQASMAITVEFKLNTQAGRSDPNYRDVVATNGSVTKKKLEGQSWAELPFAHKIEAMLKPHAFCHAPDTL